MARRLDGVDLQHLANPEHRGGREVGEHQFANVQLVADQGRIRAQRVGVVGDDGQAGQRQPNPGFSAFRSAEPVEQTSRTRSMAAAR